MKQNWIGDDEKLRKWLYVTLQDCTCGLIVDVDW